MDRSMELVDKIIEYESGEMNAVDTIEFFGDLVKTGRCWSLQGHYGRAASSMIKNGIVGEDGVVDYERLDELLMEG